MFSPRDIAHGGEDGTGADVLSNCCAAVLEAQIQLLSSVFPLSDKSAAPNITDLDLPKGRTRRHHTGECTAEVALVQPHCIDWTKV